MEKAHKNSKKRNAIYEVLCSTKEHPTAEWVYNRLKPDIPDLSLGTVYRNLNLLSDDGIIFKLPLPVERFDGFTNPHPHLICSGCGSVHDLKIDYDSGLDQLASESCGYQIQRHESFFLGLCPGCAADQQ